MNIEEVREYCLQKKGVTEGFPFDNDTLVFKVMDKIFLLTSLTFQPFRVNLKMDSELAKEYREKYPDVIPGYHMNKKHWNTVEIDGSLSDDMIKNLIEESYNLVVIALPRKKQQGIKNL